MCVLFSQQGFCLMSTRSKHTIIGVESKLNIKITWKIMFNNGVRI